MNHSAPSLSCSVISLPGVGNKTCDLLKKLGCLTFFDLLTHLPTRFILKQFNPITLSSVGEGGHVIISVSVEQVSKREKNKWRKQITTVSCHTKHDEVLELVFFNYFPEHLFKNLKKNDNIVVSGKLEVTAAGLFRLTHPKIYRTISHINKVDVVYPLVAGLSSLQLNKFAMLCIEHLKNKKIVIKEWLESELLCKKGWLSFIDSIKGIHNPQNAKDLEWQGRLRKRIAFDELLANQLAIRISRKRHSDESGEVLKFSGELAEKVLKSTGMTLTAGQALALHELQADQKSSKRMVRLLQGDVGSGKTLVALLAALNAVEGGGQVALMVPTDVLANQHFDLISKLLSAFGINVCLLTGATIKSKRKTISSELISGDINILIGTHALFQKGVEFKGLGLIVIDEQHRFGVQQRLALMNKNKVCDVLAMSATPIPRTLSLIMYGDMDVSTLKDKPSGRIPIRTITTLDSKAELVVELIKQRIARNEKTFWICPLIEEKEGVDTDDPLVVTNCSAAVARFDFLKKKFGDKVGLVHGRLKDKEKERSMAEFAHGQVDVLVATTVVEIGIDVPGATLIIIEQAYRFGLSQLHQLRGRVGRANKASDCVLIFSENIGSIARARLRAMKDSNDGFYIAEQDLKLRGGGEILGHKQSGLPEFRTVDFEKHYHLFDEVAKYATQIIEMGAISDFSLLMEIFGYDVGVELIEA